MFPSCSFNRCLFSAPSAPTHRQSDPITLNVYRRLHPAKSKRRGLWRGWCLLPLSAMSRQCTAGKWLNWKRRPIPSACETTAGGILLRSGYICRDKPKPKKTSSGSRCQSWPVFKTQGGGQTFFGWLEDRRPVQVFLVVNSVSADKQAVTQMRPKLEVRSLQIWCERSSDVGIRLSCFVAAGTKWPSARWREGKKTENEDDSV